MAQKGDGGWGEKDQKRKRRECAHEKYLMTCLKWVGSNQFLLLLNVHDLVIYFEELS